MEIPLGRNTDREDSAQVLITVTVTCSMLDGHREQVGLNRLCNHPPSNPLLSNWTQYSLTCWTGTENLRSNSKNQYSISKNLSGKILPKSQRTLTKELSKVSWSFDSASQNHPWWLCHDWLLITVSPSAQSLVWPLHRAFLSPITDDHVTALDRVVHRLDLSSASGSLDKQLLGTRGQGVMVLTLGLMTQGLTKNHK